MGNVQLTNKLQLGTAALFSPGKLLLVINCDTGSFFKVFLCEILLTPCCVPQSFLSTSWEAFRQTGGGDWPHFGHVFPVPFRFQPTDCSWLSHTALKPAAPTQTLRGAAEGGHYLAAPQTFFFPLVSCLGAAFLVPAFISCAAVIGYCLHANNLLFFNALFLFN